MPELEIRKSDFDELEKKRKFLSHSDVDVAVLDLPDRYVYTVEAKVEDMLETEHFHLIYMGDAPESLKISIKKRGKRYASDIP